MSSIIRTLIYSTFAAVLCLTAASAPALAKSDSSPAVTIKQINAKAEKLVAQGRKINMQLAIIARETMRGDKDLQAKGKHLGQHMKQVMNDKGYHPEADRKELISLKKEIESGKLSKKEREDKIAEFRGVRARVIKGQQEAMQDKSLRKEIQEFVQARLQAMEKKDPKTKQLLQQLSSIKMQLRKLAMQKQAMQHQAKH